MLVKVKIESIGARFVKTFLLSVFFVYRGLMQAKQDSALKRYF